MSHSVPEFAMTISHEEDESDQIDQEGIVFGSGSSPSDDMMGRKPSSNESSNVC